MIKKNIKEVIVFLGILMSFYNGLNSTLNAEIKPVKNNNQSRVDQSKYSKLTGNPNWQKISKVWKDLNHFEISKMYNKADFEKIRSLEEDIQKTKSWLNALEKAGFISLVEKNYLERVISERYGYLEFKTGFVLCYEMSQIGMEINKKRDDLENRFDLLEKLFKENKINSETYKQAKEAILNDYKFIDHNESIDQKEQINKELVELIILLGK
ncbi:MAG: hypothetical protein AB1782_19000 [Cyanobacteriota bacterium]